MAQNDVHVRVTYGARGIAQMSQQVRFLGRQLKMASRQSYYAGMFITRMGYAAIGAGAAIAGGIGVSVKTFATFQQAMANTASVTQATAEEMKVLGQLGQDIGKIYPKSAIEIGDAMYYMGSAGWSATQIIEALEAATMLSVGTQHDMSNSTMYLMQALKQFGKNAKDAGEFANIMAAGIASSQLKIEWLGQSLKNVGPAAKAAGVSFKETVAILGALHDVGMTAGRAGRHLRNIIVRTVRPVGRAQEALDRLGLELEEVSIGMLGLGQVMDNLSEAGATMGDVFDIFRLRAGASAEALRQLGNIGLQEYLKNLDDTQALQKMVSIQMNTLKSNAIMLKNSVIDLGISFGENFEDPLRKGIKTLRNIILGIGEFVKANKALAFSLSFLAGALIFLGAISIPMGMIASSLLSLKLIGEVVGVSLAALAAILWKLGLALIVVGVGIAEGVHLWEKYKKTIKKVQEPQEELNNAITKPPSKIRLFIDSLIFKWKSFRKENVKTNKELTKGLKEHFGALKETWANKIPNILSEVEKRIENAGEKLREEFEKTLEDSLAKTKEYQEKMTEALRKTVELSRISATEIHSFFTNAIMGMIEGTETFKDVWVDFNRMLVKIFVERALKRIVDSWFDALDQMFGAVGQVGGGTGGFLNTIIGGIGAILGGGGGGSTLGRLGADRATAGPIQTSAGPGIRYHAMGIDNVMRSGLAYIHRGETILPSWKDNQTQSQNTNYYIYAVDPVSFADLINRNPEIIHKITQEGIERNTSLRRSLQRNL